MSFIFCCFVMCHIFHNFQMTEQKNWLPEGLTQAAGLELERLSFLGPFFALSCFAEDSVSIMLSVCHAVFSQTLWWTESNLISESR